MARIVETIMGDALDRAADEAISEFGDEAQSEDGEFSFDEAPEVEDDEEVLEAADEQSNEAEPETEDDEPADGDDIEKPVEFSWDGNPDTVPENLKPYFDQVYDTMRKGVDVWMSRKATEWQQQRQAYENRLKELEAHAREQRQKAIEPRVPVDPGPEATQEEWRKYIEDVSAYKAWQISEQRDELYGRNAMPKEETPEQAMVRRSQTVESQPWYNQQVGETMVRIAEANDHWKRLVLTDEGFYALADAARTQVEAEANKAAAAKAQSAEIARKASAAKRKVSKPKTAPKKVTPARNFADMGFEEKIDAAINDAFSEFG